MVTVDRAFLERRSGKERRRRMQIQRFFFKGLERRGANDRREKDMAKPMYNSNKENAN